MCLCEYYARTDQVITALITCRRGELRLVSWCFTHSEQVSIVIRGVEISSTVFHMQSTGLVTRGVEIS